jgi:hypothetical protein
LFKGPIVYRLDCAGLDCAGLDSVGPDCAGPDRTCTGGMCCLCNTRYRKHIVNLNSKYKFISI